jgi:hypothetical protein
MTTRHPKRILGDEYSGQSQLPSSEQTRELRLPGSEYIGESHLPCDGYNSELSRLLGVLYFKQAPEQDYSKNLLVTNSSGVKTPQCIHHWEVLPT